jgi:hypothetical protein
MRTHNAGCEIEGTGDRGRGTGGIQEQSQGRRRFGIVCVLSIAFCMTTERPASATVYVPVDFTTVVHESGAIVHGRVIDVRAGLTGPQRAIESLVTVQVIEPLKGAPAAGEAINFRVPNGKLGRYRRVVVGVPEFAPGDEVVVFLRTQAPAIPTLYGLSQGVYRVKRDAVARAVVLPAPITAPGVGAERVVRGDPVRQPMPVEAFARKVQAILESR